MKSNRLVAWMAMTFEKRVGRVLVFSLRPIQGWSDTVQTVISLIGIFTPTLLGFINKHAGWTTQWTLTKGIWTSLVVLSLLLFVAVYKLQNQIDVEHDSAHNLVARISSPIRTNVGADFYHLNIANAPKGILARQTADKVAGTVQICDEDGQPLMPARIHRWAASPQIPGLPQVADLQTV
jgi:hypothetical protein